MSEYFPEVAGEICSYFRSRSDNGLTILETKMQGSEVNLEDLAILP